MASRLREEIFTAIRTFSCATVHEANEATLAIIRLVENGAPYSGHSLDDLARGESYHPGDDA
jgi:hypothetical protein